MPLVQIVWASSCKDARKEDPLVYRDHAPPALPGSQRLLRAARVHCSAKASPSFGHAHLVLGVCFGVRGPSVRGSLCWVLFVSIYTDQLHLCAQEGSRLKMCTLFGVRASLSSGSSDLQNSVCPIERHLSRKVSASFLQNCILALPGQRCLGL